MKKVAFVGWHEGSAGQIHSWFEKTGEYSVVCFIHPEATAPEIIRVPRAAKKFSYPENGTFKGLPLIVASDWAQRLKAEGIKYVLVTTPSPEQRFAQIAEARAHGLELVNAIHPSATILEEAELGQNVIMHARSFLGYRAELKDGVILNTGSQVDHHCVLESCVTIDPGVVMAGNVTIEEKCTIHTAAVIKNKIRIRKNTVIGAGCVVIRDSEESQTLVGVPARPIR